MQQDQPVQQDEQRFGRQEQQRDKRLSANKTTRRIINLALMRAGFAVVAVDQYKLCIVPIRTEGK